MAKNEIPEMKTDCRVMSKVVDTAVGLAILVIVIKPEDRPCRENETDNPRPSEVVIPITRNRPINLERSHQMINDAIDPQEWACRCGARATRRCGLAQCRKCRRRDRWHRHQAGVRRHRRGEQW
jgi:hypothetical protein